MNQAAKVIHGKAWEATTDGTEDFRQGSLLTWRAFMTKPTTLPRWALFISNGALIITVVAGAISYGRSAGRTEKALQNYEQVPKIEANVASVTQQLTEIKEMIQKQTAKQSETLDIQNKRIDVIQQANTLAIGSLAEKITAVQGQMGSVWALAQSDSNKVSELKGMVSAMQTQMIQQRKDQK